MVMSVLLAGVIAFLASMVILQAIGACAEDVKARPGMAMARVALAAVLQVVTVTLAVLLGRGV